MIKPFYDLRRLACVLAFALPTVAAAAEPVPNLDALRQEIWRSFDQVRQDQDRLPPTRRATGDALRRAELLARAPVIRRLQAVVEGDASNDVRIEALGLILEWGAPDAAGQALGRLAADHPDDDGTATVLQTAYGQTPAPDKRAQLEALGRRTRSRAVAGTALFLLAQETLTGAGPPPSADARAAALHRLQQVRDAYGDAPSVLLGSGAPPRLGTAAAALMFQTERLAVGAVLPPIAVRTLDGAPANSAAFQGRLTLIDLWATWCPPCVAGLPELKALSATYGPDRLNIVSISADDDPAMVARFVARQSLTWTQWRVGSGGKLSEDWLNGAYPLYILVGPDGRIAATGASVAAVAPALKALASQSPPGPA